MYIIRNILLHHFLLLYSTCTLIQIHEQVGSGIPNTSTKYESGFSSSTFKIRLCLYCTVHCSSVHKLYRLWSGIVEVDASETLICTYASSSLSQIHVIRIRTKHLYPGT